MKNYQNLFLLTGLILSPSAWAYLDPGSGSMLLQVLLGGAAAVGVVAKLYWYRLKRALGFGKKQQDSD
jgi:FtsH-binding integral membrane protein